MISEARLKKIEAKVGVIKQKGYKYAFLSHEEYEQGKLDGVVDPEHISPVIILDE